MRPSDYTPQNYSWFAHTAQVEFDKAKAERLGLPWPPPYVKGQARAHVTDECKKPCWFCSMGVAQEGVA